VTLFRGKFRIESTRLKGYDYASPGAYFVTICTKNRDQSFGMIDGGKIHLSELGKVAESMFGAKSHTISAYAEIDEFVVMPNHVGITESFGH
jgi:putative transposase